MVNKEQTAVGKASQINQYILVNKKITSNTNRTIVTLYNFINLTSL